MINLDNTGFFASLERASLSASKVGSLVLQKPQDQQWPLFQCNYCKRKFQNHHGSCPGCGSPHATVIWTPETHSGSYYRSYPTY